MKNDKNIVNYAILQSGESLRFASNYLKGNYELGIQCISNNIDNLRFLSDKLKKDEKFVLESFLINNKAFLWVNS